MVVGQYQSKIAENGRVALPKKYRDELGNRFVITQGYEKSLLIVPYKNWETVIKQTTNKPFLIGEARANLRFLLGGASLVDLDEQGRFVIPYYLRQYAEIKEEVIFLGLGQYIELWALSHWQEYQKGLTQNIEKIVQKLVEKDQ